MKHIITMLIPALFCGIVITGCSTEPVGKSGGDDFPNMIASAGKSITENLDQEWENPADADLNPLEPIRKIELPAVSLQTKPGKKAVFLEREACDSTWFAVDLASNSLALYIRSCTDSTVRNDTLLAAIAGDDTVIVAAFGSLERIDAPDLYEYYSFTDLDGDSALLNPNAEKQQVLAVYSLPYKKDARQVLMMGVDAGPSSDFNNADDNIVLFATYTISLDDDTLYVLKLEDGDADGYILDYGASDDSVLIDATVISNVSVSLERLQSSTVTSRLVVFPADSTKNYAIRYGVTNRFITGTVMWNIETVEGNPSFYPGDSVNVRRITRYSDNDSVTADTLIVRAIMGDDPRDSLDDLLSGIYLHRRLQRGSERETVFSFEAAEPLENGKEPTDGTLYLMTTMEDESWIEVNGVIEEELITAEAELSDGREFTVVWDREGEVVTVLKH